MASGWLNGWVQLCLISHTMQATRLRDDGDLLCVIVSKSTCYCTEAYMYMTWDGRDIDTTASKLSACNHLSA